MTFIKRIILALALLLGTAYAEEPIHLIWLGGLTPEGSWEEDWITEVFSKVKGDINVVYDKDYTLFLDKSIIILSMPQSHEQESKVHEKCKKYFKKCKEKGLRFGVVHISDEFYHDSTEFYPDARFVIRNYWHKKFTDPKTLFFPLGYKRGFWKGFKGGLKKASERNFKWSFAGQVKKSTRLSMIDNMKKIPDHHVYQIEGWNAPNSLTVDHYRDLLLQSVFVPCPRGNWNLDSFRVSEALECGCIPVVEKGPFDYFEKLFGSYPFPSVASWEEAPALINRLLANPKELEKQRKVCHQWWLAYKDTLKTKVADLVEKGLCRTDGRIDVLTSWNLYEGLPIKLRNVDEAGYHIRMHYQYPYKESYSPKDPDLKKIIVFGWPLDPKTFLDLPREKLLFFTMEPHEMPPGYYDHFSRVYTCDDNLVDGVKFFKLYYPYLMPMRTDLPAFEEKKLCVMVAGSDACPAWKNELYSERIKMVEFFETKSPGQFDVYGKAWTRRHYRDYRGAIPGDHSGEEKIAVLSKYRFCICFENTRDLPGYITEKIFGCFAAGCVPVYWGASNIETYIPKNCFIDYRNFKDREELYGYMKTMPKVVYEQYLENIRAFLRSEQAQVFTPAHFEKTMLEAVSQ